MCFLVVNQYYGADILMEYVIKGNAAVLKCSIPSFVADFVRVESWIDEEGNELRHSDNYGGILFFTQLFLFLFWAYFFFCGGSSLNEGGGIFPCK